MFLNRWFVMISIVVALPSIAAQALARHGGHATRADDAQMRDLLAKLAAASGEVEPEERTEADLMYEAMLRWNGEPPGSAAIDRALAQSKQAAAKSKRATVEKVRSMFWKDPFSDDPGKLVPIRQEDRDLLAQYNRGRQRSEVRQSRQAREPRDEMSRLRAELADAREEAATARAESARLRGRVSEASEQRSCVADASSRGEVRRRRSSGARVHSHQAARTEIALASTAPVRSERYQARVAPPPPPPVLPPPVPIAPPPTHGIIITPLPSPSPPVVEAPSRRSSSRVR
jgi:hypothetical protein